jgi:hypothetical protein
VTENQSKEPEYVWAPNGRAYQWDAKKGMYYNYDPENKCRIPGAPRKTLPVLGPKGVTVKGTPRQREYPDKRAPRSDAAKVYKAGARRRRKRHTELDAKVKEKEKELERVEEELDAATQLANFISNAPTIKQQRAAILGLFKVKNFSPVAELIDLVQGGEITPRDKIAILKALAEFEAPKPKSVDIEGEVKGTVQISVTDYLGTSRDQLKDVTPETVELRDEDYEQFETEVT